MSEDKPTEKSLYVKNKQCPICKNHFVYFCLDCRSLLFSYEFSKIYSFIVLHQDGLIIFIDNIKEILPASLNLTEATHESKTNTLPISSKNPSSSSSVKLKKSSNIFSSLVKKARRKKTPNKNGNKEIKSLHISQNSSCASTLSMGVHVEEVEISCQNYEKKYSQNQEMFGEERGVCSETNTSNHSLESSLKNAIKGVGLSHKDNLMQTSKDHNHFTENKKVSVSYNTEENWEEDNAITAFIAFPKPILNVTLADGLEYIKETVISLHENENYVISLLHKYIRDSSTQKQLETALSHHGKLQWDVERRTCSLANDMWIQQLEMGRAQEKILQNTLNSLVKQNRQLQIENENLYRKHEKTVKMMRGAENRPRCQEHDAQVDSVIRHNEKLQVKLETVFKKCECLEGELLIFQKQNDNMEQQLRNCTIKMQNTRAGFHKMKTEYELEQTALSFKLETKEQMLKEALEVGDIVLEDLDGLKRQLKNMPFGLNWSKFKIRGSCLTDLIHMCRSCINELSKEILNMHNEMALKEKDVAILHETNTKLQENLAKSWEELDIMSKKMEDDISVKASRILNEQKCRMLENELRCLEEKTDTLKSQLDAEKSMRLQSVAEFENYKREVQEKDKTIEQTKQYLANVTTENYSLKNDVAVLSQMLKDTGAGDIAREIEINQKEIDYFQRELKKLQKENNNLIDELQTVQKENGVLMANQESNYNSLQKQNKELEKMSQEVQTLRQKFDGEHQTVLSLQNERKKYLEEKNILKSIIQRFKNELSNMKTLEENLTNVTKEASKLGMVADYNKQQGEKLKKEVIERDTVIAELKTSVHKLNELHMQNAQEKLSLCYELNEVCHLKEKINEVLNTEVRKNEQLGQSQEAIVKSVNTQIQKIEEKQKNERTAIRILVKDIKIIAEERDQLAKEKNQLQLEIDQLNVRLVEQKQKCDELTQETEKKEQEIVHLKKDREYSEKKQNEINERVKNEEAKYDMNVKQLKILIDQLRSEKKELQDSNEYLKNTAEKLHKDLNLSRQNEKGIGDHLHQIKQQQEETQKALNEQSERVTNIMKEKEKVEEEKMDLIDEKDKLIEETNYLSKIMDKVVNDFEKSIKTSEEKERLFKNEFDESKKLLHSYAHQIQDLKESIHLKERQIEELRELAKSEQFRQKLHLELKEEITRVEMEAAKLNEAKTNLETQLNDLQEKYDKSIENFKNVEKEKEVLENKLKAVSDKKEEEYVFFKSHIAELIRSRDEIESQNQKEIHTLRQQLQEVNNKIVNEQAAYETLSQIHKEVSGKFIKSIKNLVDVKNSKHELADRLAEREENIGELENEKEELNKQINKLQEELGMSKHVVIQLNEENNLLQKNYNKALDKCVTLEYEIKRVELDHHKEVIKKANSEESNKSQESVFENSKKELEETIHHLKIDISKIQQEITVLQIERSEITLELHETKKKLETEKSISEQLKNTHKLLLAALLQLKDEGKVNPSDCVHLLHMVRSTTSNAATDDSAEKL